MSENTKKPHEQPGQFFNWSNGMADSLRDVMNIQVKTAQMIMDRSMALGQTFTDHFHTQMTEGMRLSQECMKYGRTLTETLNKTAFEFSERVVRNPNH